MILLNKPLHPLLWGLLFGIAGFAAGFFGPMLLDPQANQGPLLGLLITGPAGVLLGVILGALFNALPLSAKQSGFALLTLAIVGVLVTLFFCLPPPKLLGYVVDAEIKSCSRPDTLLDAANVRWKKSLGRATGFTPRAGWEQEMSDKVSGLDGVMINVQISRKRGVYEDAKPWNLARQENDRWHQDWETKNLYASDSSKTCVDFVSGSKALYFLKNNFSDTDVPVKQWPPDDALDYLEVQTLAPVPEKYK